MTLMCTGCYEKVKYYDIQLEKEYHAYNVGTCDCGGKVAEVDELILPTIQELNKKGWTTNFCCSGHIDDSYIHTYIYFKHLPNTIPVGFKVGEKNNNSSIYYKHPHQKLEGFAGYEKLLRINKILYKWALSLPKRSE